MIIIAGSNLPYVITQDAKIAGGGRLHESNHRESLPRRGPDSSILWIEENFLQTSSYDILFCVVTKRFLFTLSRAT